MSDEWVEDENHKTIRINLGGGCFPGHRWYRADSPALAYFAKPADENRTAATHPNVTLVQPKDQSRRAFATAAMQGFVSRYGITDEKDVAEYARKAYMMADAMLNEEEK